MLQNAINYLKLYMEYCYYDIHISKAFSLMGLKLHSKTNKRSKNSHKYANNIKKSPLRLLFSLKKIKANSRIFQRIMFFID